jgi:hypothetical protein
MKDKTIRNLASNLGRLIQEGQINYDKFVDDYPFNTGDDDIDKLFNLIEHQPKLGGLFGVSKITYENYIKEILNLIELLEKEDTKVNKL